LDPSVLPVVAARACAVLAEEGLGRVDCLTGDDLKRMLSAIAQRAQFAGGCGGEGCTGPEDIERPQVLLRSVIRDLGDEIRIEFIALHILEQRVIGREKGHAEDDAGLFDIAELPMRRLLRPILDGKVLAPAPSAELDSAPEE